MAIQHSESLRIQGNEFPLHEVSASDDTQAVVMICLEHIATDTDDVLSLIERVLNERGLQPTFVRNGSQLFLSSVSPLDGEIVRRFGDHRAGIIALVNGQEPGQGAHALDEMILHKGDTLELLYRIEAEESVHTH